MNFNQKEASGRTRNVPILFWVTEEEKKMIRKKMILIGISRKIFVPSEKFCMCKYKGQEKETSIVRSTYQYMGKKSSFNLI